MYICLISSCIYRLLHVENAGNAVIDIIIEWRSFIDCQMYISLNSSCVYGLFDAGNVCNVVINIIKWSCFIDSKKCSKRK